MEHAGHFDLNQYAKDIIRHKAQQLIGNYGFTLDDLKDIEQDLWLDLLQRLPKYNAERAQFSTFICLVVDHKISTIIRYHTQEKRDWRCHCSLDDPVEDPAGTSVPRGETLSQDECDLRTGKYARPEAERIDLQLDLSIALSELPPDLKLLAEQLMIHPIAQVARDLGIPRSTLYEKGIGSLRRHFMDKGLEDYL